MFTFGFLGKYLTDDPLFNILAISIAVLSIVAWIYSNLQKRRKY